MADSPETCRHYCNILRQNENVRTPDVNWDDITRAIVGLTIAAKHKTYRSQTTGDLIWQCKKIIEKSFSIEFDKGCTLRTHVFRFLRNCCVESRENQEYVISMGLLPTVIETLEHSLKPNKSLNPDDNPHSGEIKQIIESGIQVLGNLVTGNEKNQDIVWAKCYSGFFQNVMDCDFEQAKNYICMVMYNCMRLKQRPEMLCTPLGISLTHSIVEMCCKNEKDVEWGIFILESFLGSGCFNQLYDVLHDKYQRIFLLNLIEDKFKASEDYDFWISWISVNNLCYLAQILEENISKVIQPKSNLDAEEMTSQIIFVSSLLRLLCFLTSFPKKYVEIRNRISLLECTLVALRETSTAENKKFFSNVSQFPSTTDNDHSLHPAHNFKKNLVQLIGNMCYHNRRNQDCVRQIDCIPLLLDHCNVDDYNPYICQWAILALRNILEKNPENQEVIKSLEKIGLARNERLLDAGFLVQETTNNRIKIEYKLSKNVS